jgi:hypothetical protein
MKKIGKLKNSLYLCVMELSTYTYEQLITELELETGIIFNI